MTKDEAVAYIIKQLEKEIDLSEVENIDVEKVIESMKREVA